jgi:malate dehydrogenase (oxaloacetate-decarboxylating)(NADP+)
VLQLGSSVRNIIDMALIAVVDAQQKSKLDTEAEIQKTLGGNACEKRKNNIRFVIICFISISFGKRRFE